MAAMATALLPDSGSGDSQVTPATSSTAPPVAAELGTAAGRYSAVVGQALEASTLYSAQSRIQGQSQGEAWETEAPRQHRQHRRRRQHHKQPAQPSSEEGREPRQDGGEAQTP